RGAARDPREPGTRCTAEEDGPEPCRAAVRLALRSAHPAKTAQDAARISATCRRFMDEPGEPAWRAGRLGPGRTTGRLLRSPPLHRLRPSGREHARHRRLATQKRLARGAHTLSAQLRG